MQNTSKLSPTFYKGKPFWEKQDSFRKTAGTNRGIPTTVKGILPQVNPSRTQILEALVQDNPIKTPIRVLETLTQETRVPEKMEFTLGYLLVHLRRKLWHRIFLWSAIKTRVTATIEINRRVRKEKILLTNIEIMEITEDPVINMTRRSVIKLLHLLQRLSRHLRVPKKSWLETLILSVCFVLITWG